MPGSSDPRLEREYQALVEALAREGLPVRTEATRAMEATMCALAQRISGPDFDELRELLPEPFRGRLFTCERHSAAPAPPIRSTEAFYDIVASDLGRDVAEVEPVVRAVFAAVRAQLPEKEAEDVAALLPPELDLLWRRPS